jgi:hypothetical protein
MEWSETVGQRRFRSTRSPSGVYWSETVGCRTLDGARGSTVRTRPTLPPSMPAGSRPRREAQAARRSSAIAPAGSSSIASWSRAGAGSHSAAARWRRPASRVASASSTAPAPTRNGASRETPSASLPARNGAIAPPAKRRNEYAEEATGPLDGGDLHHGLGEDGVDRAQERARDDDAGREHGGRALAGRHHEEDRGDRDVHRGERVHHARRARTRGATKTENTATIRPQPKKTAPRGCARPCGAGTACTPAG